LSQMYDPPRGPSARVTGGRAGAVAAPLLVLRDVVKQYTGGGGTVTALKGVNLTIYAGRITAIRGRSGAGKTTLLNVIGGLDDPTSGSVAIFGRDLGRMSERERTELRRHELGFIFQSAHLDPVLTALENVQVPLRLARMERNERERRSRAVLKFVGLEERLLHRAPELSGGEQQRVAIARALVHAPHLVLADEPTGSLDSHTGLTILELMRDIAHDSGISFIIASHDPQITRVADELHDISDGVLTLGRA
jgi:ABC-type lipoprotein export system ATPase subunit